MRIGIFFGGQSREREISFAGGRTVYDNLDKRIFTPVPIFVDGAGNFILLDWAFLYKGTIRDFYPPVGFAPASPNRFRIYADALSELAPEKEEEMIARIGKKINPENFAALFDFAFLALHGPFGEDGNIQGLLEWYNIPYSGAGILPSAIGIDKNLQKKLFADMGFPGPKNITLTKTEWEKQTHQVLFAEIADRLGCPFVVKAAHQGSSIGVSIVKNAAEMESACRRAFFVEKIGGDCWKNADIEEKKQRIHKIIDLREGIGMPLWWKADGTEERILDPEVLLERLDAHFARQHTDVLLEAEQGEFVAVIEEFIYGKEFSCIVIEDEAGKPLALPPTEIVKTTGKQAAHEPAAEVFDYRAKYLPGMVHKITPIGLPSSEIENIRAACCRLFQKMNFQVYARIDGFVRRTGEVILNDPNTTSGMLPSSFFFHQAAEIGMNPSQFLTYIIRTSLAKRLESGKNTQRMGGLLKQLDAQIGQTTSKQKGKQKIAVIMGGYSAERHISVESGRNIYEKLASSEKYEPIPVFLSDNRQENELFLMPVNILLKDNADDIKQKIYAGQTSDAHPIIQKIISECGNITKKYVGKTLLSPLKINYQTLSELANFAFIALHGRPGEDGSLQAVLEQYGIAYNGSGVKTSQITIDKFNTNRILREKGVLVADHCLIHRAAWQENRAACYARAEAQIAYPLIAKPADDGCSAAVKKINNRKELQAFSEIIFRENGEISDENSKILGLKKNEVFPQKTHFLIESLIAAEGAVRFLEITGGMLIFPDDQGRRYEVFPPSEALATDAVLTLEEKFLAGEGQNITPARFADTPTENKKITEKVTAELQKVAEILGVEGYCRIDAFVRIFADKRIETVIIEVNSLPGMTPATCIFHQAALKNYKPYEFIEKIIENSIKL